jgi:hypothetical protein
MNIKQNTLALALTAALSLSATTRVEWLEEAHNFGAFDESIGQVSCQFKFVNTGDEPVVVIGARATCGCTTPKFPTDPIAPGDTAAIDVTYNANGRPGRFIKKVYVDTNTSPSRQTLTITGVVIGAPATVAERYPVDMGPLKMRQPAALLGEVAHGHVKSVFLDGYNQSPDTITPVITTTPKWLEVTPTPRAVAPGEQLSLSFFVTATDKNLWGTYTDSITILPDKSATKSYSLPVIVTVNEDFSNLSDQQIAKSPAAKLSTQLLNLDSDNTITISNTGKSPLNIRRIYTLDKGINATVKKTVIKPGANTRISVSPSLPYGPLPINARLVIITDDPLNPTQTVRVTKGF